jgi:microcystin-dependent protein
MQPFVGQIIPVGFNFAPPGWLLCQGQLVSISEFSTLFTLIGTTYGGDGQVTFGIPDLRGRAPLHYGQGNSSRTPLSNYTLGERTGTESVTLLASQIGQHTHPFMTSTQTAKAIPPGTTTALGIATAGSNNFVYGTGAPDTTLAPASISQAGGSLPHENRQPFQAVKFLIAWAGIFPSRN